MQGSVPEPYRLALLVRLTKPFQLAILVDQNTRIECSEHKFLVLMCCEKWLLLCLSEDPLIGVEHVGQ